MLLIRPTNRNFYYSFYDIEYLLKVIHKWHSRST